MSHDLCLVLSCLSFLAGVLSRNEVSTESRVLEGSEGLGGYRDQL